MNNLDDLKLVDSHMIRISDYNINHKILEPTEVSDYDYDPDNPNRRFLCTYIHKLEIQDRFTDEEIISINFSSEVCAEIVSHLYGILYSADPNISPVIDNIYYDKSKYPIQLAIVNQSFDRHHVRMKLSFIDNNIEIATLILDRELDIETLILMLDNSDDIMGSYIDEDTYNLY